MSDRDLDETDQKILSILSKKSGISYSRLADEVGVSRNTTYRRIKELKDRGIIKDDFIRNNSVNILELEKLGVTSLLVGLDFPAGDLERASSFLKELDETKLLLESYGDYDFFVLLFCNKGEREVVSDFRKGIEEEGIVLQNYDVFPVSLKKLDLTFSF